MVTINILKETKERFKKAKLKMSAQKEDSISEEEFVNILLDKFEGKKR